MFFPKNLIEVRLCLPQTSPSEFTEMAWEGIVGAVDAARVSKQQVVETEHLMKALLEQKDGLARRVLTKAGLDNTSVLQAVDDFISQQPKACIQLYVCFSIQFCLSPKVIWGLVTICDLAPGCGRY